jgi:NADH:ubiquinone reductase (non-electrogenic)
MPSKAVVRPLAQLTTRIAIQHPVQRSFGTVKSSSPFSKSSSSPSPRVPKPAPTRLFNKPELRRGFAEQLPNKQQVKKGGWRMLKWTWRITYLSVLGGLAYTGYGIYRDRNPAEQMEPDPSKKTLVVLGMEPCCDLEMVNTDMVSDRYGLGIRLPPQETRYGKLQRRRHLATQLLPLHPSPAFLYHRHHRAPQHHGTHPQLSPPQAHLG